MATLETQQLDEVIAGSRRRMLTLGGAALAGLALTSMVQAQAAALTDADYLNFALNLEYLEAQYYTLAVSGQTIDQVGLALTGTGTQGTVVTKPGGPTACKVPFTNMLVQSYAMETAKEERNHVSFLRGALGAAAVAQPQIDLYNSFNYLATLLGISGLTSFDPFADDASFLLGSYIFEDVGVTAYTGAAPALTVSANLDAAAGIQAVEAYHAGLTRTTIYALDQTSNTVASAGGTVPAGTLRSVATAISKVRVMADATGGTTTISAAHTVGDDIGLGMGTAVPQMVALNTAAQTFPATSLVDATTTGSINPSTTTSGSMVFARTATQVLGIVYAGGTTTSNKGFFPVGLNGNVK